MGWNVIKGSRLFAVAVILCIAASCTPPENTGDATKSLISEGFLRRNSSGDITIGPGLLSQTQTVVSKQICQGAVGSILPPLAIHECVMGAISTPIYGLEDLGRILSGSRTDPNKHLIFLSGIDHYWVKQTMPADCWAATLEIARDYMRLIHVSQNELLEHTESLCPLFRPEEGADAFQIEYAIASELLPLDQHVTSPHFCSNIDCLLVALTNRHPVIMLNSQHATLVVGAEYTVNPGDHGKPNFPLLRHLLVLDPDQQQPPKIKTIAFESFCTADAFIAY